MARLVLFKAIMTTARHGAADAGGGLANRQVLRKLTKLGRRTSRRFRFAIAMVVALTIPCFAQDDDVWLSANDPTHGGAADFWDMFRPGADWTAARSHVRVVSIAQNLVTNGPPDQLRMFYAFAP